MKKKDNDSNHREKKLSKQKDQKKRKYDEQEEFRKKEKKIQLNITKIRTKYGRLFRIFLNLMTRDGFFMCQLFEIT